MSEAGNRAAAGQAGAVQAAAGPSGARDARASDLLRAARLAHVRQELARPVESLMQFAQALPRLVRADCPANFRGAVDNIVLRSKQLFNLVDRHLGPLPSQGEEAEQLERKLRHDLRGHAAYLIGVGQLWEKRAAAQLGEDIAAELRRIRATAEQVVALLDRLASFGQGTVAAQPGLEIEIDFDEFARQLEQRPSFRQRGRLLVVDDNEANRQHLTELLGGYGHEVAQAADGVQALELVARGSFDLILLDMLMPGLSGLDVLALLKEDEKWQHIPVVMISALDGVDSVIQCIGRGAEDYLTRPVHPQLLQVRIGACLEKKQLRDREQAFVHRIDELLHAIFPHRLVEELQQTSTIRSRRYEKVGVLFLDIVGFTPFCDARRDRPEEVMARLQELVLVFEEIVNRRGVQKIKTIGDSFMAAAGLFEECPNPVYSLLCCGLEMIDATRASVSGWEIRVGIHVGPLIGGVLGRSQYGFDLWGNTVNVAARMESHGRIGRVTLSREAWREVESFSIGEERAVEVKGLGRAPVIDFVAFRSDVPAGAGERPAH